MAQYLVLLYEDEQAWAESTPELDAQVYTEHMKLQAEHGASLQGGSALQLPATATSIRSDGAGGFLVTDGPFVETKEALCGFYLIEAADLDEAVALAKKVPAPHGGVEIRPVRTFD